MKEVIVGLLSSRRVLATVGGFLGTLLVPVLNAKLGLGLDPAEVVTTVTGLVVLVATYVVSRTASKPKVVTTTTTAAPATPPALPPEVQAVVDALTKK